MTRPASILTERLSLRPIAAHDFPHWQAFYSSDHSRFVGGPKTAEEAWWKLAQFIGHWAMTGFGYWSVETRAGTYLGRVGLEQPVGWPEPELGWSFLPECGGQGYATEAAQAVREDAIGRMNVRAIVSFIHPDNAPSIRVAERMGAVLDKGTAAAYPDHLVYRHPMKAGA